MLPDVEPHDRLAAAHNRAVLVRSGVQDEFAIFDEQPGPTRAETPNGGLAELGLELRERAEGGLDGRGQLAGGLAPATLLHDLPEHRVVRVAAGIIAHGRADVFGDLV